MFCCRWAGYFTSRPALKGYVRDTTTIFAAARQLQLQSRAESLPPASSGPLLVLEQALGIVQHHDAVAGTSKQHVANDYAKRLAIGRSAGDAVMSAALANVTGYTPTERPWARCDLANVTICEALEAGMAQVMSLYNPQSTPKAAWPVRIPVGVIPGVSASWSVVNASGSAVPSQLLAITATDAHLRYDYYKYHGSTPAGNVSIGWLVFVASRIPAQGISTYFLIPSPANDPKLVSAESTLVTPRVGGRTLRAPVESPTGNASVSNGIVTLTVDTVSGLLTNYASAATGVTLALSQDLLWYKPTQNEPQVSRFVK